MKTPHKIAIVGAGGITCHLLPILSLDHNIVLIDGDKFEPDNSTRQFPALHKNSYGVNKAEYLASIQAERAAFNIEAISNYLEGPSIVNNPAFDGTHMVFGCVDNNESRRLIVDLCDRLDLPGILCGNETEMGEAHLILPGYYDPFDHHDFGPMTKAPFSCTADENAESAPQTSAANFLAAACGMHILAAWRRTESRDNLIVHSVLDTRAQSRRTRYRDLGATREEIACGEAVA